MSFNIVSLKLLVIRNCLNSRVTLYIKTYSITVLCRLIPMIYDGAELPHSLPIPYFFSFLPPSRYSLSSYLFNSRYARGSRLYFCPTNSCGNFMLNISSLFVIATKNADSFIIFIFYTYCPTLSRMNRHNNAIRGIVGVRITLNKKITRNQFELI